MMFQTIISPLAAACLVCVTGSTLAADDAPARAPDWRSSGNLTLASDYLFRGLSQTQAKPTVQATLDFSHASGFYAGLFGSGVSHAAYNNGSGSEVDVYGGYRYPLSADSNIDAGLVSYWYPGAHYGAGGKDIKYHSQEAKLGLNMGSFNAYAWVALSQYWFGFALQPDSGRLVNTRGTAYLEANWNPELAPGLVLNVHAGRQQVRNMSAFNFVDLKAGVTQTVDNWALSVAATYNSGDASKQGTPLWTFFDADGSGKYVAQKRLLLTVARNF